MIFCGFVKASNPGVNPQKLPPNIHKSAAFYLKPKSAETQAMNFKSAGFIILVMRKIKITVKILRFPSELRQNIASILSNKTKYCISEPNITIAEEYQLQRSRCKACMRKVKT